MAKNDAIRVWSRSIVIICNMGLLLSSCSLMESRYVKPRLELNEIAVVFVPDKRIRVNKIDGLRTGKRKEYDLYPGRHTITLSWYAKENDYIFKGSNIALRYEFRKNHVYSIEGVSDVTKWIAFIFDWGSAEEVVCQREGSVVGRWRKLFESLPANFCNSYYGKKESKQELLRRWRAGRYCTISAIMSSVPYTRGPTKDLDIGTPLSEKIMQVLNDPNYSSVLQCPGQGPDYPFGP